ncbi:hypothetical protein VP01_2970g1 [Puccinia sorghi]|uniref:Uncharacterized protein n=1 Tax=Puccinia sorghi TaxID=27349 RepID=A0A0L6V0U0_9BASI|nr:hypothetical protein VP01_2970g1 [Puccinia sorghi]
MTYAQLAALCLDDVFWQDMNFFHPTAAWATNADVRKGIQAVHVLDRASEELEIIAHEVVCAISWAIEFESLIKAKISELDDLEKTVEQGDGPTNIESWTSMTLGNWTIDLKLALIKWELVLKLREHREVVTAWADDANLLLEQIESSTNGIQSHESWGDLVGSWHDLVWRASQGIRPELSGPEANEATDRWR